MVPKHELPTKWRCEIFRFDLNLRQVIVSSGGKRIVSSHTVLHYLAHIHRNSLIESPLSVPVTIALID